MLHKFLVQGRIATAADTVLLMADRIGAAFIRQQQAILSRPTTGRSWQDQGADSDRGRRAGALTPVKVSEEMVDPRQQAEAFPMRALSTMEQPEAVRRFCGGAGERGEIGMRIIAVSCQPQQNHAQVACSGSAGFEAWYADRRARLHRCQR
jgi:hypothetical protein